MSEKPKQNLVELTDAEIDAVAGGAPAGEPGYGIGTGEPEGLFTHGQTGIKTAIGAGGIGQQGNIPGASGAGHGQRTAGHG